MCYGKSSVNFDNQYEMNGDCIGETRFISFHEACKLGYIDIVETSLQLGQDPDFFCEETGDFALHVALLGGHKSVVESLVNYGADPNLANRDGLLTPLHILSLRHEDDGLLDFLFEISKRNNLSLHVNARDSDGNTPLQYAVHHGKKNMAQTLLKHGADPDLTNVEGATCLHLICTRDYDDGLGEIFFKTLDDMNRKVRINLRDDFGMTALHRALVTGKKGMTRLLLERNADPNIFNGDGSTPLHIISSRDDDDDDLAELFFTINKKKSRQGRTLKVRMNAKDRWGNTPLHCALYKGNKNMVKLLIKNRADPNARDAKGLTPLHIIANYESHCPEDLARTFLATNKKMNQLVYMDIRDRSGNTPLRWAVVKLLPELVDILLDYGADLSKLIIPSAIQPGSNESKKNFKLIIMSGVLAVAERLQRRGYKLNRRQAYQFREAISRFRSNETSATVEQFWYEDQEFAIKAKNIMMKPNLSLYNLVKLSPEEAQRKLTCKDYLQCARSIDWYELPKSHMQVCADNLCEKVVKAFIFCARHQTLFWS